MASFREQKIARKKREILRSAAAVLAEKGYHGTTMEEIAAQLLMTKGSMYYYFKNKDDILYHCHQMIMELSLEKIEEVAGSNLNPEDKLESAIKAHILLSIEEKSMFMIMDKPSQKFTEDQLKEVLDAQKKYAHFFDQILKEGVEKQVFDIQDIKMVRMIILGALNSIQHWYNHDGPQTGEEIANAYAANLLKMVVKNNV
ncbi:TetR/AcrR family transcriptional regulator [Bacillus sp. FJAT-29814]|uniref:TetR/AcrR family transcriptional regulator n=1 Tax=Bacillus sp. FJAT-29814 TaxID=1729688 RepID=UPI0008307B36|nr:TetR/AcrR family transcriptional regulator [Bacillus sp. FJAT-29814]